MRPLLTTKKSSFCARYGTIFGFIALLILTVSVLAVGYITLNGPNHSHHAPRAQPISNLEAAANANIEAELRAQRVPGSSAYYTTDGEDDLMTTMPLLNEESCADSPTECGFNQYSGYLM